MNFAIGMEITLSAIRTAVVLAALSSFRWSNVILSICSAEGGPSVLEIFFQSAALPSAAGLWTKNPTM